MGFPDFIILGAQKSGTTALYYDLCKHSKILKSSRKEIHYFDKKHYPDHEWYKNKFPEINGKITGESSPSYLFLPFVPYRIKETIPGCKFIIILRNPVDRAYSQYNMDNKNEISFEKLIENVLSSDVDKLLEECPVSSSRELMKIP